MSANEIPEQIVLRGRFDEDVPAILTQSWKRVELKGDLHVPPEEMRQTSSQLTLGTLELRSENTLAELGVREIDFTPVALQTWSD